jgi:hypothetical protein
MTTYRFTVSITLQGPVLSQAAGSRDLGLDAAALRANDGAPLLPGNLIRGNLRHAWDRLRDIAAAHGKVPAGLDPDHLLGTASNSETDNAPIRGRLRFSSTWRTAPAPYEVRHRIAVSPKTGAVQPMALQVIDAPFATDEKPTFVGTIDAELADQAAADRLGELIRQGLEFSGSIGALKGVGFGHVLKVQVAHQPEQASIPQPALPTNSETVGLSLSLDRPFCIGRPHSGNNLFESEDFIPGGVIRGAMARRLFDADRGDHPARQGFEALCKHFARLGVSHALPVDSSATGRRPLAPPFSLVQAPAQAGSDELALYDVALRGEPAGLIHGRAPAFAPDWKGLETVRKACGLSAPLRRDIAVRTAIDPNRGTAEQGKLFATETVRPDDHRWRGHIHLGDVPAADRPDVIKQLAGFFSEPLTQMGKTKAEATCNLSPQPDALASEEGDPHTGTWLRDGSAIVCLQSDALLLPDYSGLTGAGAAERLRALYADAWLQLSGETLALDGARYFARQALVGGDFLHHRFARPGQPYNPWLTTLAGSVFVLTPTGKGDPEAKLRAWRQQGLGQVHAEHDDDATRRAREDWQHNPYLRQNGYGAVAINLALHWDRDPGTAWQGINHSAEAADGTD